MGDPLGPDIRREIEAVRQADRAEQARRDAQARQAAEHRAAVEEAEKRERAEFTAVLRLADRMAALANDRAVTVDVRLYRRFATPRLLWGSRPSYEPLTYGWLIREKVTVYQTGGIDSYKASISEPVRDHRRREGIILTQDGDLYVYSTEKDVEFEDEAAGMRWEAFTEGDHGSDGRIGRETSFPGNREMAETTALRSALIAFAARRDLDR